MVSACTVATVGPFTYIPHLTLPSCPMASLCGLVPIRSRTLLQCRCERCRAALSPATAPSTRSSTRGQLERNSGPKFRPCVPGSCAAPRLTSSAPELPVRLVEVQAFLILWLCVTSPLSFRPRRCSAFCLIARGQNDMAHTNVPHRCLVCSRLLPVPSCWTSVCYFWVYFPCWVSADGGRSLLHAGRELLLVPYCGSDVLAESFNVSAIM